MKIAPQVSILIPAYEQLDITKKCLENVARTLDEKISYEIILIDDQSSESTVNELKQLIQPPHKLLLNSERKGFAHNNNLAAREAQAPYLCLLNNDVFVQGNWLEPMLQVLTDYPDAGMVGNVQKRYQSPYYDHMGFVFSPQGHPRHFGQFFFHRPFQKDVRQWSAVTAACCVCRKDRFEEMKGFDEIFINGCEDVDLCLRMAKAGYKNYVVHDSVVIHVKGATKGRKIHNVRNARILDERWGEYIRSHQSVNDQKLHARTYIWRFIIRPWSSNLNKFVEALLIQSNLKRLPAAK